MKKVDHLKNIFQNDNWDAINKAEEFMEKSTQKTSNIIRQEIDNSTKQEIADNTSLENEFSGFKNKIFQVLNYQNEIISNLIKKMNEVIAKNNNLESELTIIKKELLIQNEKLLSTKNSLKISSEDKEKKVETEKEQIEGKEQNSQSDNNVKTKKFNIFSASSESKIVDHPIDRNNVAPSDVQIEKIFNCSHKKF